MTCPRCTSPDPEYAVRVAAEELARRALRMLTPAIRAEERREALMSVLPVLSKLAKNKIRETQDVLQEAFEAVIALRDSCPPAAEAPKPQPPAVAAIKPADVDVEGLAWHLSDIDMQRHRRDEPVLSYPEIAREALDYIEKNGGKDR